jgi:hypothetical protein
VAQPQHAHEASPSKSATPRDKGLGSRFKGWIKTKLTGSSHHHDADGHDADSAGGVTYSSQSCSLPARRRASFATINLDFGAPIGGLGSATVATYSPAGAQVPLGAASPGGASGCHSLGGGQPSPSGGSFTLPSAAGRAGLTAGRGG